MIPTVVAAGLTGNESRSGVVVAIHEASAKIKSGKNKDRRSAGKAVEDADGDPVTAETDEDGVFEFEGLVVGRLYFLMPESTGLYTAVRNGSDQHREPEGHGCRFAGTHRGHRSRSGRRSGFRRTRNPDWDAHTSTLEDEGPNDFALLYKNGEVEGEVSDPSVREAHQYATVELHRCKTTDYVLDSGECPMANQTTVPLTECTEYVDDEKEACQCGRRRRMDCRRPHGRRLRGDCGPPGRVRACGRGRAAAKWRGRLRCRTPTSVSRLPSWRAAAPTPAPGRSTSRTGTQARAS